MSPRRAALRGFAPLGCLLASAASLACGAPFRGGYTTPDEAIPGTRTLARFVPGRCEDAARGEHTPRFSSIELLETSTGRTLLLEHRPGHELLVIENFHDQGSFFVFEVVVRGGTVRRFRIPRSAQGTGTLQVGRELAEVRRGERFETGLASSHLTCTLLPQAGVLPVASASKTP